MLVLVVEESLVRHQLQYCVLLLSSELIPVDHLEGVPEEASACEQKEIMYKGYSHVIEKNPLGHAEHEFNVH